MARPTCVHCGKPYGQRDTTTETVRWPLNGEKPPYRGNGMVAREVFHQKARGALVSQGNDPKIQYNLPEQPNIMHRHIWDGESWFGGYDPFCTLRCALDYARQAYARSKQPALRRVR